MTKIKILLNGESREVPENLSIKELFIFLDLSEKHCAVEINKEIIVYLKLSTASNAM